MMIIKTFMITIKLLVVEVKNNSLKLKFFIDGDDDNNQSKGMLESFTPGIVL